MKTLKDFLAVGLLLLILLSACSAAAPAAEPATEVPETAAGDAVEAPTATADNAPEEAPQREYNYTDLNFDEYLEITYRDIRLRTPELYIELGLDSIYGDKPLELNDPSYEFREGTFDLYQQVLDGLDAFDRAALSDDQQLSFDLYQLWLQDYLSGYDFRYHEYIETGMEITSASYITEFFFSDTLPVNNFEEAQDYVTRLAQVDEKFQALGDALVEQSEMGIITPQIQYSYLLSRLNSAASSSASSSIYYTSLVDKLDALDGLDSQERKSLLDQAEAIIADEILPAYQAYVEVLRGLSNRAPSSDGVWQFEQGDAYYEYLLAHYTTTALTAAEIHQLGLDELDRIQGEMRALFDELGYPQGVSLEALYTRVAQEGGTLSGEDIRAGYEAIIARAEENLSEIFSVLPQQELIVVTDDIGGFYVPGSLDGSRPGAFYAGSAGQILRYTMPTFTYHEAIPGHHLQIALAQEMDLPTFRRVETIGAYVEGWGLYAERLADDLGWYDDDPYGNLGRLQFEALRAARLVVDTGIHSMGWTFNEAVQFFTENTGFSQNYSQGQIYRYIAYPGQATGYMIGMLKLLELRGWMETELGADFDIKVFHQLVLENGSMPLDLLALTIEGNLNGNDSP